MADLPIRFQEHLQVSNGGQDAALSGLESEKSATPPWYHQCKFRDVLIVCVPLFAWWSSSLDMSPSSTQVLLYELTHPSWSSPLSLYSLMLGRWTGIGGVLRWTSQVHHHHLVVMTHLRMTDRIASFCEFPYCGQRYLLSFISIDRIHLHIVVIRKGPQELVYFIIDCWARLRTPAHPCSTLHTHIYMCVVIIYWWVDWAVRIVHCWLNSFREERTSRAGLHWSSTSTTIKSAF